MAGILKIEILESADELYQQLQKASKTIDAVQSLTQWSWITDGLSKSAIY